MSAKGQKAKRNRRNKQREADATSARKKHTEEQHQEAGRGSSTQLADLPVHVSSLAMRQEALLLLQRQRGNAYVQQLLAGRQSGFASGLLQREGPTVTSPATPPKLKDTGIGTKVSLDRFAAAAKKIKDEWDTLKTAKKRATTLGEIAIAELEKAGVPSTNIRVKDMLSAGQFSFSTWTLQLGKKGFEKAKMTDKDINAAADTVYHEARHAEQWYRMAQLLASRGKTAGQIKWKMSIPLKIAKAAVKDPLKSDSPQKAGAESWYESVYGAKASYRNKTLRNIRKFVTRLKSAKKARSKVKKAYEKVMKKVNKLKKNLETARDRLISAEVAYFTAPEGSDKAEKLKMKTAEKRVKLAEALAANAVKYGDKAEKRLKKADEKVEKVRANKKKAHQAYKNLPEESDAWKIGDKITSAMEAMDKKDE